MPGTIRRCAGAALITSGLTLAGIELFSLGWRMGSPNQYELIARGAESNILIMAMSTIFVLAIALSVTLVSRYTRGFGLGFTDRYLSPGLTAVLACYLVIGPLSVWVMVPIGLVSLAIREPVTWALVGAAVWIGTRLVRGPAPGLHDRNVDLAAGRPSSAPVQPGRCDRTRDDDVLTALLQP